MKLPRPAFYDWQAQLPGKDQYVKYLHLSYSTILTTPARFVNDTLLCMGYLVKRPFTVLILIADSAVEKHFVCTCVMEPFIIIGDAHRNNCRDFYLERDVTSLHVNQFGKETEKMVGRSFLFGRKKIREQEALPGLGNFK